MGSKGEALVGDLLEQFADTVCNNNTNTKMYNAHIVKH